MKTPDGKQKTCQVSGRSQSIADGVFTGGFLASNRYAIGTSDKNADDDSRRDTCGHDDDNNGVDPDSNSLL
jgi:hypothetical protein